MDLNLRFETPAFDGPGGYSTCLRLLDVKLCNVTRGRINSRMLM